MTRTVSGSTYTEYTGHQGEPESLTSHMTSQPDINDETKASSSSSSDSSEAEESEVPDASIPPPEAPEVKADDFESDLEGLEAKLKSNLANTDFSGSSILRQVEENVTESEETTQKANESSSSSSSSSSASFETSSDSD